MTAMTTTMAMEAMIESLKQTSVMVEDITSKLDLSQPSTTLPALKSMVITPSTLCSTCWKLLNRDTVTRRSAQSSNTTGIRDPYLPSNQEFPYHSLDDLAKEAVKGCHLCLLVYLGLDSDALQTFARTLIVDSVSTPWKVTTNPKKDPSSSLGFVSLTPTSNGSAKLSFRYVRSPMEEARQEAKRRSVSPTSQSPGVKSSFITAFDLSNFEAQRASVGYFFDNPNIGVNRLSSVSQLDVRGTRINQDLTLRVDLTLVNPQTARGLGVRTVPMDSVTTASDDGLEIARDWIKECTENHFQCASSSGPSWRPMYLLDVSIRDARNNPGLRLMDGPLLDRLSEYVTLSHSWGPEKPVRLHKGTASALRQGVAWSSLPSTLADAALVTRNLGYKYLWIDALCIMHDDEQVVLKNITEMHKIYSNAVVNIAATCAWSDTEGFIRNRNVAAVQPCILGVQGHSIDNGTYMVLKPTGWDDLVDKAPLQRRAWVFQERALAKRALHFTRSELIWECQQVCCSETHPKGIPEDLKYTRTPDMDEDNIPVFKRFDKQLHHRETGNWGRLVELFSTGKLSYQTDKLLAMSGLARQYCMANKLKSSDYVVGMWKPELPQSLLWKVDRGHRPTHFRAPTWSWAGVDGHVRCPINDAYSTRSCLDVIDIELLHKYNDNFSLCQGARLRVRGFLGRGLLQRKRDYWGETTCSIQFPRARVRVDFDMATFDEELSVSAQESLEVYVLPVLCSSKEVEGLLLAVTERKGEYERLGTFNLLTSNNDPNCERFRAAMSSDHGLTNYEERQNCPKGSIWFSGSHRYVIDLM